MEVKTKLNLTKTGRYHRLSHHTYLMQNVMYVNRDLRIYWLSADPKIIKKLKNYIIKTRKIWGCKLVANFDFWGAKLISPIRPYCGEIMKYIELTHSRGYRIFSMDWAGMWQNINHIRPLIASMRAIKKYDYIRDVDHLIRLGLIPKKVASDYIFKTYPKASRLYLTNFRYLKPFSLPT